MAQEGPAQDHVGAGETEKLRGRDFFAPILQLQQVLKPPYSCKEPGTRDHRNSGAVARRANTLRDTTRVARRRRFEPACIRVHRAHKTGTRCVTLPLAVALLARRRDRGVARGSSVAPCAARRTAIADLGRAAPVTRATATRVPSWALLKLAPNVLNERRRRGSQRIHDACKVAAEHTRCAHDQCAHEHVPRHRGVSDSRTQLYRGCAGVSVMKMFVKWH